MNKLLFKIDYDRYLICTGLVDEQNLLAILSRAKVVKRDWSKECFYHIDEIPKVDLVDAEKILASEPIDEPAE